ncbi:MAG: class II aldolase/adducin family protein [Candidatus Methylacidiphilales bacterium]
MSVFSIQDAQAFIQTGAKTFSYDRSTRLTPSARDALSEAGIRLVLQSSNGTPSSNTSSGAPSSPGLKLVKVPQPPAKGTADTSGYTAEDLAIFNSPEARQLKEEICDIGRRIWAREYVDGNGGNISCRVAEGKFLCTPTGVSKGFLKPEMLGMVDIDGKQLAGTWKRTSEVTTHLAIYRNVPEAFSVCHAHPVHATAFAIAGLKPPPCLIPEIEVFVGEVAVAPYRTPGSPEMADVIGPMSPQHQSILMGNHGVICWGTSVEDAYFKMEITDAYCRTLIMATQIPDRGTTIPDHEVSKLLDLKKGLGLPDSRYDLKPAQLCEMDPWATMKDRPCGCSSKTAAPSTSPSSNQEFEDAVQRITNQIINALEKGSS